jgi:DNA-binding ferritin-like protein (Dps family)
MSVEKEFFELQKEKLRKYREWIRKLEKTYYEKYSIDVDKNIILNWQISISVFEDNFKIIKDMIEIIEQEGSSDIEELNVIIGNCIYAISKILFEISKELEKNDS